MGGARPDQAVCPAFIKWVWEARHTVQCRSVSEISRVGSTISRAQGLEAGAAGIRVHSRQRRARELIGRRTKYHNTMSHPRNGMMILTENVDP